MEVRRREVYSTRNIIELKKKDLGCSGGDRVYLYLPLNGDSQGRVVPK